MCTKHCNTLELRTAAKTEAMLKKCAFTLFRRVQNWKPHWKGAASFIHQLCFLQQLHVVWAHPKLFRDKKITVCIFTMIWKAKIRSFPIKNEKLRLELIIWNICKHLHFYYSCDRADHPAPCDSSISCIYNKKSALPLSVVSFLYIMFLNGSI